MRVRVPVFFTRCGKLRNGGIEMAKPRCSHCNRETDQRDFCNEGGICTECEEYLNDIKKDEQRNQVTRDMALDAGDPAREGEWIR